MHTRRNFIKQGSLAATGLLLMKNNWFAAKDLIGLQLYTVRNELKDVDAALAKIAGIGFNSIEVFGYNKGKFFGKTATEFSELLKKHNFETPSGHYMLIDFLSKGDKDVLKETVDDAARLGHKYLVIPFLFDNLRTNLDDYKKLAVKLNTAGEAAKKAGMKLLYHNHNFEFQDWGGGQTGFDVFVKETDPSLVGFELDFYWVVRAGLDPVALIKSNKGRVKAWHVKDMAKKMPPTFTTNGEQFYTEVGTGIIDYKEIFKHKKESGMEYFYIEQDQTSLPVFESITKSFENFKKNIKA